jgi:Ca2+-binding RTX toxin-like protein
MTTITVSTTAGLTAALNNVKSGTTIQLAPGTYTGVSISNVHTSGVTITSQNAANHAVIAGLGVTGSSGITFSNLAFTTVGSGQTYFADRVTNSSNIVFNGNAFHGDLTSAAAATVSALELQGDTNVSVTGSTFQNIQNGITEGNNTGVTISNNQFSGISGDGIDNGGSSNVSITGNAFTDFVMTPVGQHQDAIQFWTTNTTASASNITIDDNSVKQGTGVAVQGIFVTDQTNGQLPYENLTISNNTVVGGEWNGIVVASANGVTMTGNQVVAISGGAYSPWIGVSQASNVTMANNSATSYAMAAYGANTNISQTNDVTTSAVAVGTSLSSTSTVMTASEKTLQLTGSADVVVTGNNLGDTITANLGADVLNGGTGADTLSDGGGGQAQTMNGGGGNDTFYVNNSKDIVTEVNGGSGAIVSTVSFTAGANIQSLMASGSSAITLTGYSSSTTFSDGTGKGIDTLVGSSGADTFLVTKATDVVVESGGANGTILTSVSFTAPVNVTTITATGSSDITLTGNNQNDTLTGNGVYDILIAGNGNDVFHDGGATHWVKMTGGTGTDTFYVDNSTDVVTKAAGGQGTVITTVSYTAPINVQTLTATGTAAVTLKGNTLADTITANSGADTLTGGSGADTFVFGPGQKLETVTNFSAAKDKLDITALLKAGQTVSFQDHGSYASVVFSGGDVIQLLGVHASTLHVSGSYVI